MIKLLPDTFGLEDDNNKHEAINMKKHDFRAELSNQKITNQSFMFEAESD